MTVDEQIRVENFKIDMFTSMGASVLEAFDYVEAGVDWHEVNDLVADGCPLELAVEIVR